MWHQRTTVTMWPATDKFKYQGLGVRQVSVHLRWRCRRTVGYNRILSVWSNAVPPAAAHAAQSSTVCHAGHGHHHGTRAHPDRENPRDVRRDLSSDRSPWTVVTAIFSWVCFASRKTSNVTMFYFPQSGTPVIFKRKKHINFIICVKLAQYKYVRHRILKQII